MLRFGPLVYGACHRVVGRSADAEDAFQATFLVFVRESGRIGPDVPLGGWYHTVATRVALRGRRCEGVRRVREREAARNAATRHSRRDDWLADLDAALQALPYDLRLPLTLCHLQGLTGEEAAVRIGCSRSTLTRGLAEGGNLLRERMMRFGYVVPAVALLLTLKGPHTRSLRPPR